MKEEHVSIFLRTQKLLKHHEDHKQTLTN